MSSNRKRIYQQPVNWVQRIALYVTHGHYYLIGSNNTQTAFKILKVGRSDNELNLVDDGVEYNYHEIRDLLIRLNNGNLASAGKQTGISKTVSSFGLVGFVRFLHGYYLILIIKRRKVAEIGYHTIYKVEDTKLVYIPNQQPSEFIDDEARFVKAFSSMDLSSNFYFSYSYDISHTLQYNLCPVSGAKFFHEEARGRSIFAMSDDEAPQLFESAAAPAATHSRPPKQQAKSILVKTKPMNRYVWNSHLIDFEELHDDWKINLIHGFVAQANICVYSKPIYITLIARRSKHYSGTRFIKRGLNLDGNVANEVETEQIVHDASISNFSKGFFTSFVQIRGSLPDRWSQDATKMVPKPAIQQDFIDPYHEATAKHFNDLLTRYGTPVVVLNLIKQKEKKVHEGVLNEMLDNSVRYLNQFLPQQHIIRLIKFDMARCNKSRNENVMQRLGKIGFNIVRVTGVFRSWRSARKSHHDNTYTMHLRQRTFNRRPSSSRIAGFRLTNGQWLQNGIVRVNCVDSLDRTNTAQFVLGKVALAFQLQALGVLIEPTLAYDTDTVRLLEQLYEDHGDTIALQYGGSQLVHRVKTYRKVAPITSHSSEIMQSFSRYYSNTFSDSEKQNVINIFLGVRRAFPSSAQAILDHLVTDYYLHNELLLRPFDLAAKGGRSYRQWWDRNLLKSLPRAYKEHEKDTICYALAVRDDSVILEDRIDFFSDAYKPYELTHMASCFSVQMLHTIKDFMPSGAIHSSPFLLRLGPGKLKEMYLRLPSNKRPGPNPSIYGLPSTDSDASELSSILDSELSDDSEPDYLSTHPTLMNVSSFMLPVSRRLSRQDYTLMRFLSEQEAYSSGSERRSEYQDALMQAMTAEDYDLYKNYVSFDKSIDVKPPKAAADLQALGPRCIDMLKDDLDPDFTKSATGSPFASSNEFVYAPLTKKELTLYHNYVTIIPTLAY